MRMNVLKTVCFPLLLLSLANLVSGEEPRKRILALSQVSSPEQILDLHSQGVNLTDPTNNRFLVSLSYPLQSGKGGYYFNKTYHYREDLPERTERILLKTVELGIDVNMKDENGRTLLLNALQADYKKLSDKLIAKGADISAVDKDKRTTLMHAAEKQNMKIALFLLEKGLDAKAKDKDDRSVLLYALRGGSERIVQALLKQGAAVNHKDKSGITPLMQVSYFRRFEDRNHLKTAEALLKLGARVNSQDNRGWTPLIYATYHGETEIALRLIEAGADVDHKDKHGRNAMKFATVNNRKRIIAALEKRIGRDAKEGQEPQQSPRGDSLKAAPQE